MKYLSNALVFAGLLGSFAVFADEGKSAAHPCAQIKSACEAAGYVKGGHKDKGKGLFVDCLRPLMNGAAVAGVSLDPSVVQACKAKKAERKEARGK